MPWNVAIAALATVFILAAVISMLGFSDMRRGEGPLQSYLLAGGGLGRVSVVNLLVSTSFGVNTMLYQGFLGATVGWWGLLVQAAWAAGYLLLARRPVALRNHRGLHDFLGVNFGARTRIAAAFASLAGITIFLGWETSIGRDALRGMLALQHSEARAGAEWLIVGTVMGCLLYTVLGGLRGNAVANTAQNLLKLVGFSVVTIFLGIAFFNQPNSSFWSAFFPPLSAMTSNLGWWGLITSIAFGLAWQFVDMSTWQSLAASSKSPTEDIQWNLRWSGYLVFLTPGVLGTIFGVFLSHTPGASANVLVAASRLTSGPGVVVSFLFAAAIMASIMSLIDGLFLASTYAFVVDLLHASKRLPDLDQDERVAESILFKAKLILVVIAVLSIWAIPRLIAFVGHDKGLFFFSFVVIVAQLALLGPVLIALRSKGTEPGARPPSALGSMWIAIAASGALGFACALIGGNKQIKWLVDGAGTFTIAASLLIAWLVAARAARSSNVSGGKPV